jgi:hypothetical protein
MRGKVRNVPHKRRYLALAILALAVAAAAAMTTGSLRVPIASAAGADTCGYSGGADPTKIPTPARATQKFNEIGILEGLSTSSGPSGNLSDGTVNVFYSDEHALTIGVSGVTWNAFYDDPATVTKPPVVKRIDDAGAAGVPPHSGTPHEAGPVVLDSPADALPADPGGRAVAPALYISDVTGIDTSSATYHGPNDWQAVSATTGARLPDYVGGTWKNNAAANPLGSDGKEAKNGNRLGPNSETFVDNISTSQGLEGYGAELRWNVSNLRSGGQALKPGHTYRVQMMLHDGDHNADTGEACKNITIPPKPTDGTTTASGGGQLTKDATGVLSVSTFDTATLTGGTRNAAPDSSSTSSGKLTFNLYQVNEDGNGTVDCGLDANGNAVNADLKATKTVNGTNGGTGNSGGADNDAAHPLRGVYSTQTQPVKLTLPGTYYWTVSYSGNIENTGFSETACGETAEKVVVTKAPSKVDTEPKIKLTEDIKITLSASANAGIKVGDKVDVSLFMQDPTGSSPGCLSKDHAGGLATQQGTTKQVVLDSSNFDSTTGAVNIALKYPEDFGGTAAPAIANGNYFWFVEYEGNDQVTGSNDDCHETFTISGL